MDLVIPATSSRTGRRLVPRCTIRLAVMLAAFVLVAANAPAPPPANYYNSVDATNATTLRSTLHAVIDDHTRLPYTHSSQYDTWDMLESADQDPLNSARVLEVYKNTSFQKWNAGNNDYDREHTWPKSYGFPTDVVANMCYTDCHMLYLSFGDYNSSRNNRPYDTASASWNEKVTDLYNGQGGGSGAFPGNSNWVLTTGPNDGGWQTWVKRKGDVARACLYMDIRYEGGTHGVTGVSEPNLILTNDMTLIVTSSSNVSVGYMGRLSTILQWHADDPVDANEQARNDKVFARQGNRNPFIDNPSWVSCLYSGSCGGGGSAPAAPASLTYPTSSTTGSYSVSWASSSGATSYQLERSSNGGSTYSQVYNNSGTSYSESVGNGSYMYRVRATNANGSSSYFTSATTCVVTISSGPANNNFASASAISGTSGSTTGTNVGANKETGEPNHASNVGGASVWYTWAPSAAGSTTITTLGSSFDTTLHIYTGSAVGSLTSVGGNDDASGNTSSVTFTASAGTTYRIAVDGYKGSGAVATGNITLNWNQTIGGGAPAAPASISYPATSSTGSITVSWASSSGATSYQLDQTSNGGSTWTQVYSGSATSSARTLTNGTYKFRVRASNASGSSTYTTGAGNCVVTIPSQPAGQNTFASSGTLTGNSGTATGSNSSATKETGEPSHAGNAGGKSLWWRYTPSTSGTLTVNTTGSSFDTTLAVYTGSAVNGLTVRGSNDDNGSLLTSLVSVSVTAGTTYHIAVDGYDGASGSVTLNFSKP